jgi:F0F1-type ATP synthase assembly protein I
MPKKQGNLYQQFGKYYGLAFLLPVSMAVGYGIGYGLDKLFHTAFLKVVFLLLGIASGIIELVRDLSQDDAGK